MLDKIADGIPVEGMEALAPVLLDRLVLLARRAAGGHPRRRLRPRAGAVPSHRPRRDQPGVPRRVLGRGGRWRSRADRPRRGGVPDDRRRPQPGAGDRPAVVDREPVHGRRGPRPRRDHLLRTGGRATTAATSSVRSTTSAAGCAAGWRVVLVTEGHGSAERLVEVLRGEDIAARLEPSHRRASPSPRVVHVTTGGLDVRHRREHAAAGRAHREPT